MTANELADHILDVKKLLDESTPDEFPHILEGGLYRLMLESSNEWQIYKIYCAWTKQHILTDKALKSFYTLQEKIKESQHDKIIYNGIKSVS
jgi:hypothetical protein